MFRKPKNKNSLRQRTSGWDEEGNATIGKPDVENNEDAIVQEKMSRTAISINKEGSDDETEPVSKPPALLSFDHDEGADVEFTIKKNKKKIKELKRLQKLEEEEHAIQEAEEQRKAEEKRREAESHKARDKERSREKEERRKNDQKKERERYLDKYRDESTHHVQHNSDDEIEVLEDGHVEQKFTSSFAGIPDSRAVYEAKKRRERMRREGNDGFIALDDTQKLKEKGTRERLIREDDNDDSDEDAPKFYSAKSLAQGEEERRRGQQNDFLEQEQGDNERDEEADEWEKQQILKAVSRHTIGQIRTEYDNSARLFQHYQQQQQYEQEEMDMDIDMDVIVESYNNNSTGPVNGAGEIKIEDFMAKLKLRMQDREEALNARRLEVSKMEAHLEENKTAISKIELDAPVLANKYVMYQEMRSYSRSLLNCLNEKIGEINDLSDKRRNIAKARTERLMRRRKADMKDAYNDCCLAAAGKAAVKSMDGGAALRSSEREARRARRRRERESSLAAINHDEGLSTDDEETTSQQVADQQVLVPIDAAIETVFIDAEDDYAQLKKVLERMMDWLAVDGPSFEDAYVHLCIPKLVSPYIRLELMVADILDKPEFLMSRMQWYEDALMAGANNMELDREHPIIVGIIPLIVEKIVLPYLIDIVNDIWEPMSLKHSTRLGAVLCSLNSFPTLGSKTKPLNALLQAVHKKFTSAIDDELFVPTFSKVAIENPSTGCAVFLNRQYWSAIKLIRCISCMKTFLSPESRFDMVIRSIISRVCVLALQFGITNDAGCERKVRALISELTPEYIALGDAQSFRSILACLNKIAEDQKNAGRDFHRELRKFIEKLSFA